MINNKILHAHVLRVYTWELLKANIGWTEVNGMIPIVPLGDEPRLSDSGKSYIIYGYAEQAPGSTKEVRTGSLTYRIIARTFAELGEITNVITAGFEELDRSAHRVNLWSSNYSGGAFIGIRFGTLEVTYIEGGEPADQEGGPVDGLLNIEYSYIIERNVKQYQADGTWA